MVYRILVVVFCVGCTTSISTGQLSEIECESNNECPDGFTCNVESNRCLEEARTDLTPPRFSGVSVTPGIGNATTTFEIAFIVDEPLSTLPALSIDGPIALTFVSGPDSNGRFVYRFRADEAFAPEQISTLNDRTFPISIDIRDEARNVTIELLGESIRLDTVAPTVADTSIAPILLPAPTNPLRSVETLGDGTTATLIVTSSEPTDACLELVDAASSVVGSSCVDPMNGVTIERTTPEGVASIFEIAVGEGAPDGVMGLRVQLEDTATNTSTTVLESSLTIDRTAPPAPELQDPDSFVLVRAPFGLADKGPGTALELLPPSTGFLPAHTLIVYATPERIAEVARFEADGTGSFESSRLDLASADRQTVFLSAVDRAGNESAAAEVLNVEYVMTPAGRIPGGLTGNQTELVETLFATDRLFHEEDVGLDGRAGLLRRDDLSVESTARPALFRVTGDTFRCDVASLFLISA
ncbi:MAG: hypothetical protein AAF658_17665, partial [Myxococcota bacterium]